jgi:single-stranded-DNA-specific exonuclease
MRRATLSEDDIGFTIAPRINAASRMDDPDLAFRLLTTDSMPEAEQLAQNLEELNAKRKTIVAVMVKEARKRLRARYIETDRVVVLGDPSWKPSLLGLAANSIVGDRGGVALLWGRDANGAIKGSARSDGTVSVLGLFEALKEYFEAYGGHTASGGFTAHFEKIHALPGAAAAAFSALEMNNKTALASHEALVSLREVSQSLLAQIGQLAPFGTGNPKPILKVSRSRIVSVRRFGKEKNHTEVTLACPETGAVQRGFQYFKAPEHFSRIPESNLLVDVFATLENDTFRGNTAPVLRLVDIFESN